MWHGANLSLIHIFISRLNRVSGLPDNIGGPYVNNYSSNDTLTFFFIQQLPGAKGEIDDHQALIEARVKPELERIPGVSTVDIEGINERQIQIRFDPYRAAELGVEIPVLASQMCIRDRTYTYKLV